MSDRNELTDSLTALGFVRVIARIFALTWLFLCMGAAHADELRYVWALQGANLRDAPSATAKIVAKLNYGDAVNVLPASGERVPYDMSFFPKAAGQAAKSDAMPVLSGAWVKVEANNQQGYVFDKLLLHYAPIKKGENIPNYFARIFGLTAKQPKGKVNKDGAEVTIYVGTGKNKTEVEVDYYPQSSGSTSSATIPGMSFDEAFVMVNAIMPPDLSSSYSYHQGSDFDYMGRDGSMCKLSFQNGVVSLDWADEP